MNYLELPQEWPPPVRKLLPHSEYNRGDSEFSITDLIAPPQITQLVRRHDSEIWRDPRENVYSVLGSAVHNLLEKIGLENPDDSHILENRLFATIDGVTISGQIDLHCTLSSGILTDYKNWKTSAIKFDKQEAHQQLNCYSYLLRKVGYEVAAARVCVFFRDWKYMGFGGLWTPTIDGTKIVCKKTKDYPEWGVALIEIPLWPNEEVEKFLKERIALHKLAKNLPDEELPECSLDERWRRDTWRVRKIGSIRAKGNKAFKSEEDAKKYLEEIGPEFELSARPGIPYRCIAYCVAAPFCQQLKRENFEVIFEDAEVAEDAPDE